jgi:DNA-directed RNA polymerase subunit RPC12/RpoP
MVKARKATGAVMGRCMKCKKQVEIKGAKEVTLPNGRKAAKGTCGECGTNVFRMGAMK